MTMIQHIDIFIISVTLFYMFFIHFWPMDSAGLSGSRGDDLLLPDTWVGGAYRHGGKQTPATSPACVLRLQRELQRGVDAWQPQNR